MSSASAAIDLPLSADGSFRYGYRQSIYGVPVEERERAEGATVVVLSARSKDRRSLEYYRWGDDTIAVDTGGFVQQAPGVALPAPLQISVTEDGAQWIEGDDVRVDLLRRFGANIVSVSPRAEPRISWLFAHLTAR